MAMVTRLTHTHTRISQKEASVLRSRFALVVVVVASSSSVVDHRQSIA